MNSDKTLYDWKRYWIPHESHEESYFEYSSLYNNNEKSTLSNLRDKKCLILLGDAALGKSTVLSQEYKALQKAGIGVDFIYFYGYICFFAIIYDFKLLFKNVFCIIKLKSFFASI